MDIEEQDAWLAKLCDNGCGLPIGQGWGQCSGDWGAMCEECYENHLAECEECRNMEGEK